MSTVDIPFENDAEFLARAQDFYAKDTFAFETIGIQILAATKDQSFLSMPIASHLFNAKGGVQGGAIFSLADLAAAVADYSEDRMNTTVDGNIQYLRVPSGTTLYCHCYAQRNGKTLAYYRCDIFNDQMDLVAVASFTYYHFQVK